MSLNLFDFRVVWLHGVLNEVKPSCRISPFIRFDQAKKIHRNSIDIDAVNQEL
ncbi:hypothetical protein HVA01_01880 [Halovibrio variabilis]|uniref:Uncharacterized protein n=1 Tax=Halovibrio variabilis TaxID=31910 RepID=A0A511UN03_9GAMM|nr:hypothetical protein HVA01_01880 [Halovibrio variabilis]